MADDTAVINFEASTEDRYDRHRLISWWDQEKLSQSRVIVAGAGALGNEVLKLLALMGFGHILVVDFDTVSRSNLTRMVLFRESDVGRPKVEVAVERVRDLAPDSDVLGVYGDLRFDVGLGRYQDADIVFGCLDSVNARWALNRKCQLAGTAWIDGGTSDFHGHVTRYDPDEGPCYECTFTEATHARFQQRYSCPYGLVRQVERAVPTTAITTSIIAALQVQEALHRLHGFRDNCLAPGERLSLYVRPYRMFRDTLIRSHSCLAHERLPLDVPQTDRPYEQLAVEDVIAIAAPGRRAELELAYDLVVAFQCPTCATTERVMKPKEKVHDYETRCAQCGAPRVPELVSTIDVHSPLASLRLREVGLPPEEVLRFRALGDDHTEYMYLRLGR